MLQMFENLLLMRLTWHKNGKCLCCVTYFHDLIKPDFDTSHLAEEQTGCANSPSETRVLTRRIEHFEDVLSNPECERHSSVKSGIVVVKRTLK